MAESGNVRLAGWIMLAVGAWNALGGLGLLLASDSIRQTGEDIDAALSMGPVNPFDNPVVFGWAFLILGSCVAVAGWGLLRGFSFARGLGVGALSVTALAYAIWGATTLVGAAGSELSSADGPSPLFFASGTVVMLGFFMLACIGGAVFLARSNEFNRRPDEALR